MSNVPMCAVMHFEMPYKDRDRAARFYAAAFGWAHQQLGPEMGDYLLVTSALPGERPNMPPGAALGAINGGLFPFKADWPMQHPSVVIDVDNVETAMARVVAAGGEVLGEPMDIPGVGRYVSFVDTEGNRNSMMAPSP
ncbi:VOC family protein [Hydrogenophaga sp. PAMC20947]|uniref:VOC family protein n=1 Tax=Hydrogenophaga sp. PAMC20947 TaxID=2565558 RepID=UPI001B351B63|nr:VOC family protein [Hydrogenophaga sp. PAMC20947]